MVHFNLPRQHKALDHPTSCLQHGGPKVTPSLTSSFILISLLPALLPMASGRPPYNPDLTVPPPVDARGPHHCLLKLTLLTVNKGPLMSPQRLDPH